jgi:hypothetical protein
LDPAPYRPERDVDLLGSNQPPYNSITLLQFGDLKEAATKLLALGNGYSSERDDLMREQLLFDVPLFGLAIATVASGIFNSSKDQILALGLGSAGFAAGRLYFGPQVKIAAYNAAGLALVCASSVADTLYQLRTSWESQMNAAKSTLMSSLAAANDQMINNLKLSPQDRSTLLAARDQGQKGLNDLNDAIATLSSAPSNLQMFARTVIKGATTKVVSGTQNIEAVLSMIKATPTGVPTAAAPPAPAKASLRELGAISIPALADTLQKSAVAAEALAKQITDAWATLSACSPTL